MGSEAVLVELELPHGPKALRLVKWPQGILGLVGCRTRRCLPTLECDRLFGGRAGRLLPGDALGHYGFGIAQKEGIFPCKETVWLQGFMGLAGCRWVVALSSAHITSWHCR